MPRERGEAKGLCLAALAKSASLVWPLLISSFQVFQSATVLKLLGLISQSNPLLDSGGQPLHVQAHEQAGAVQERRSCCLGSRACGTRLSFSTRIRPPNIAAATIMETWASKQLHVWNMLPRHLHFLDFGIDLQQDVANNHAHTLCRCAGLAV